MATENPDSITGEHHVDNALIQIVDKDGEFIDMQRLQQAMTQWQILDKGFDYYVVAILGCQSSGKSTLLNLVFGTEFQTMEASKGRTQTTLGVWMGKGLARSEKEETVLVFDVEGTDSRERGEQAHSFERKSSLFSLAMAEVLLINMWHTDVGRYNAGNIALLKTVFELNLQLFQRANGPKTLLLFVIRDHIPQDTPLEKLQGIIMKDMKGIWDSLIKPDVFANSKVEDFFDFEFTALPHKVLAAAQFTESAVALRDRFVNGKSPNFILAQRYRKDIPIDGFPSYAQRIWAVVKDNKDLNIPSQKQMLAIYRCDEISAESQRQFAVNLQPLKKRIEAGEIVENFGAKTSEFFKQAVAAYNNHAQRYQKDIADQKREALQTTLTELLFSLFAKQLLKLNEKAFNQFESSITGALPKDNTAAVDFANIVEKATKDTLDYYNKTAKALMLEGASWAYDAELEELQNSINKHIAVIREAQLNKLNQEIKSLFGNLLFKPLDRIIDNASPEMWQKIRTHYETNSAKVSTQYRDRLQGFGVSTQETEELVAGLDATLFKALKDRFIEKVKYLDFILSKKFEEHFNLDSEGLPRRWKPEDDVPKIYKEAKQRALELIELFCIMRLDPALDSVKYMDSETSDIDPKLVILSSDEASVVKDKFLKDADATYLKALRDQETVSSVAHVPVYIIALIILLGFNEFIWILTNPLLLIFTLLVGGGAAVLYMLNLGGPAKAILESVLSTSVRQLQYYAQQQLQNSQQKPRQKSEEDKKND